MRTYLAWLTVGLSSIAGGGCGSATCSLTCGESSVGGSDSAGHNNGAGSATAGSAGHNNGAGASGGAAGNTSGGSSSAGGRDGTSGTGFGGTLGNSGSGGSGGRTVDARCPAQRPMGACGADEAGLACQYDNVSGCLCYPSAAGTYTPCQKVDPTCPSTAAPTPAAGAGGAAAKVAPPPQQVCSCSASIWSCHF